MDTQDLYDPNITEARLGEIIVYGAGRPSYRQDQVTAMRILLGCQPSYERDKALAELIHVADRKQASYSEAAARELLESPTATNQELQRIVETNVEKYTEAAAKKMVENGSLNKFQEMWIRGRVPHLLGLKDTEENQPQGEVFRSQTGR